MIGCLKRQAEREDGQLLILPSDKSEEVGALSDPTSGKSSDGKGKEKDLSVNKDAAKNEERVEDVGEKAREQKAERAVEVSREEADLRDAIVERVREAGVEVVTDVEEGQRVLDEYNERVQMSAGKKKAPETASVTSGEAHQPTVVSSADGTKVLKRIDTLVQNIENLSGYSKTFIGDIAKALGAQRYGNGSTACASGISGTTSA